eukprot:11089-Pelagomonas_calceolata.AAC.12
MRERAEETGSWLWLTKNCAKRRALMTWMASIDAPAPLGLGDKKVVQSALLGPPNPHSIMTPPIMVVSAWTGRQGSCVLCTHTPPLIPYHSVQLAIPGMTSLLHLGQELMRPKSPPPTCFCFPLSSNTIHFCSQPMYSSELESQNL